jgi:hypothetical protein
MKAESEQSKAAGVEFFNFGNQQTYHFFCWVTENFDTSAQVRGAFARAGEEVSHEWSDLVEDALAERLGEMLEDERLDAGHESEDTAPCIGDVSPPEPESLFEPILAQALRGIDMRAVAEAVLLLHRKGFPASSAPEVK